MKHITAIDIGCPGCGSKNKLGKRPDPNDKVDHVLPNLCPVPALFIPSFLTFTCDLCESVVMAKLVKPKSVEPGSAQGGVKISARVIKTSQVLKDILEEERKEREQDGVQPRKLAGGVPTEDRHDGAGAGVHAHDQGAVPAG